jgi:hypothetical protein
LVQRTGCSCFMGNLNAANKDKGSCLNHNLYSLGAVEGSAVPRTFLGNVF